MSNMPLVKRDSSEPSEEQIDVSDPTRWRPSTPEEDQEVDSALGLQMISIRLHKEMIDQLKALATDKGLKYQPFVRMILTEHVKCAASTKT